MVELTTYILMRNFIFLLGIIPVSYLLSRFTEQEILMPHHGLGPEGGDALAKALVVILLFSNLIEIDLLGRTVLRSRRLCTLLEIL